MSTEQSPPPALEHGEPIPLIIVEGFLGGSFSRLWGDFAAYLNKERHALGLKPRRCFFASVGPVSSLHDRACELYYALVGGIVDYGEEHSRLHGHKQFGADAGPGLYQLWSCERPLHFFGHSIGGPTIVKLQDLLKQGRFGSHAKPEMIRSIIAVSSPFRGTQLTYILGQHVDAAPAVRHISIGSFLAKFIHLFSYFSPLFPETYNLHLQSRPLTYKEMSIPQLLKQLWYSDWAASQDAAPYEVTFKAMEERERNGEGIPHPKTFYLSTVSTITPATRPRQLLHPSTLTNDRFWIFVFSLPALLIESFDFKSLDPSPIFLKAHTGEVERGITCPAEESEFDKTHCANDGVVPLFSQWHPLSCNLTECCHDELFFVGEDEGNIAPQPGIWYVQHAEGASHMSMVPLWFSSPRQRKFWVNIGEWLKRIEK